MPYLHFLLGEIDMSYAQLVCSCQTFRRLNLIETWNVVPFSFSHAWYRDCRQLTELISNQFKSVACVNKYCNRSLGHWMWEGRFNFSRCRDAPQFADGR